jgi:hypothetical protein
LEQFGKFSHMSIDHKITTQVREQIRNILQDKVWCQVKNQIYYQVGEKVCLEVRGQVNIQVYAQPQQNTYI